MTFLGPTPNQLEWFKRQIKRETVRIDSKGDYVRLEDVVELVERAFEDVG